MVIIDSYRDINLKALLVISNMASSSHLIVAIVSVNNLTFEMRLKNVLIFSSQGVLMVNKYLKKC